MIANWNTAGGGPFLSTNNIIDIDKSFYPKLYTNKDKYSYVCSIHIRMSFGDEMYPDRLISVK